GRGVRNAEVTCVCGKPAVSNQTIVVQTPRGLRLCRRTAAPMIPESHPLQQLFVDLVGRHYAEEIGIRDPQIVSYVSHLLAEFCDADQLFKIRNGASRALSDVGEMLVESNPVF